MTKQASHRGPPALPCYDDLMGTWQTAWQLMSRGAVDRKHAFHLMQVATIRADGRPTARTVVLRGCDPAHHTLRFHTDARSAKLAEIAADPRGTLHLYDRKAKIQLRCDVSFCVLEGDERDQAWAATRPFSRTCYQVTTAPGSPIGDPYEMDFDPVTTADGSTHFRAIQANVHRLEWLYLAAKGHRRAQFSIEGDTVHGAWLVP